MRKTTICFDLDGTIANYNQGWQGLRSIGKPLKKAVQLLQYCRDSGYRIIIYSCRSNPILNKGVSEQEAARVIEQYFIDNKLPYDEIYTGPGKPVADAYVDDKAVFFNQNSNVKHTIRLIEYLVD